MFPEGDWNTPPREVCIGTSAAPPAGLVGVLEGFVDPGTGVPRTAGALVGALVGASTVLLAGTLTEGEAPAGAASPDWCVTAEHAVSRTSRQPIAPVRYVLRICVSSNLVSGWSVRVMLRHPVRFA